MDASNIPDSFSGAKKTQRTTTYLIKRQWEKKNAALNHCLDALSEGLSVDFGFLRYAKMMTRLTMFFCGFLRLPRHPFLKHSNHLAELRNTQGTSL